MNTTIGYIANRPANVIPPKLKYTGEYSKDVHILQWAEYWSPQSTFDLKEWQHWQMNVGEQTLSEYEAAQREYSDFAGYLSGNHMNMSNFAGI